jgi:hypothetical protein
MMSFWSPDTSFSLEGAKNPAGWKGIEILIAYSEE